MGSDYKFPNGSSNVENSQLNLEFEGNSNTSENETPNLISSTGGMKSHKDLIKIRE